MATRVRYGILGYGRFAERAIAPSIIKSSNSTLVALQKRSLSAAMEKARGIGVPLAFDSVEALAGHADVDAVFICSANSRHYPETLAAARAGKHVIVEKPMALTVQEGREMIRVCEENGVQLMVGHMVRLSPVVQRVHEIIRSGVYGPVVFARADFSYDARLSGRLWLFDMPTAGGGPLYDIGVHCLDTLRFLLEAEVRSAKAHMEPPPSATATEATAHLSLQFESGVPASIYCSYAAPYRKKELEVVCREATLFVSDFTSVNEGLSLIITKGKGNEPPEETREQFQIPDLYIQEVTMFSDAVLGNRAHTLTGWNALQNMAVLEEAIRQCRV